MTSIPQSPPGSARVRGEHATRQSHMEPTASGHQATITDQPYGDTVAGKHTQEGCGNGTFVVGMLVRCEACGKKFINSFYLRKHILKRHSGDTSSPEGLSDAGLFPRTAAAVPLQSGEENSSPRTLAAHSKTGSRAPGPADTGAGGQDKVTESHSERNRQPAWNISRSPVSAPQYTLAQNEVLASALRNRNEEVKGEVHTEVNDILKTFQTMLKNEIKGLQTQLAGLEIAGESRHQTEEVTSDPDEEATCKTSLCTGMRYESRRPDRTRPGSAPERELASVRSASCMERNGSRDAKEILRQAIRTLLTYSHREFFFRAQMPNVVKHNSKPLPEEIERHLGLPSLSISSQLAKSFLKEGFQHCHRSGLTTGNAPQNFELSAGAPPLFGPDKSCSYHLHKSRDFTAQRRFSLKLTRLRDRLRFGPLSTAKFPPPSTSATYMGMSAITQRPISLPLVHKQLGYRQLVQPLHPLPYPHCSSLLSTFPHVDPAGGPSALVHEEQLSKPFALAQQPPARHCPDVDVRSYTPDRTPPHGGIQRVSARQRQRSPALQSTRNTVCVSAARSTILHSIPNRGMSTSYVCSGPASTGHREPLKERAKSVVEVNCPGPAYRAEVLLSEPSLQGKGESDCLKSYLPPASSGAEDGVQRRGAWPCPSSWMSVPSHGPGSLPVQQPGCPARITPSARSLSATRVPTREEGDDPVNATAAHLLPRGADDEAPEPESSTFYAKGGRGTKDAFLESSLVEAARPSLLHQDLWQYTVHER